MSFLTEYFDEYRQHPIKKTEMCRPEYRWPEIPGNWYDATSETGDADSNINRWSDEETQAFIKKTMKSLRGQSAYYNHYCAHLDPEFKTRPFVPRRKKLVPCRPQETAAADAAPEPPLVKLAIKDTELMKIAHELYERDVNKPSMKPLRTHARILSYVRPCLYHTGISDYQSGISRLAYELVRNDKIPKYVAHNGGRPKWGLPPEGTRQPEVDVAPFDGERLY